MESPLGPLTLVASDRGVRAVRFGIAPGKHAGHPVLYQAQRQLALWFDGRLKEFNLPLDQQGTPFQRAVWLHLMKIPWGQTTTYGEIARSLGKPGGSRAVGGACGANPLPIIIPCHRVLAAGGRLGGYSGGLEIKVKLLAWEGVLPFSRPGGGTG